MAQIKTIKDEKSATIRQEKSQGWMTRLISFAKNDFTIATSDVIWQVNATVQLSNAREMGIIFDGHEATSIFTDSKHPEIRAMVTPEILNQMKDIYREMGLPESWNTILDTIRHSKYEDVKELAAFPQKLPVPKATQPAQAPQLAAA